MSSLHPQSASLPPAIRSAIKLDRAQHAHVLMLHKISSGMAAIEDLVRKGFVPVGLTLAAEGRVVVQVESPDRAALGGLPASRRTCVAGTYYEFVEQPWGAITWELRGGERP